MVSPSHLQPKLPTTKCWVTFRNINLLTSVQAVTIPSLPLMLSLPHFLSPPFWFTDIIWPLDRLVIVNISRLRPQTVAINKVIHSLLHGILLNYYFPLKPHVTMLLCFALPYYLDYLILPSRDGRSQEKAFNPRAVRRMCAAKY